MSKSLRPLLKLEPRRSLRRLVTLLTVVLMLGGVPLGGPGSAWSAGPPLTPQEIAQIKDYFVQAKELRDRERFADAIDVLQKAVAIRSVPWLTLAIAQNYESMGELEVALSHYRLCITASADEETRDRAQNAVRRLEHESARSWLVLEVEPPDAQLTLDGKVQAFRRGDRLELTPGPHELRLVAPGYRRATRELVAERGRVATQVVRLEPLSGAESSGPGVGTWVLLGSGGALVAGGIASYVIGASKHDSVNDLQAGKVTMTRVKAQALVREGDNYKLAGYIAGGVGVAALVTGLVLALTVDSEPDVQTTSGPEGSLFGLGLATCF